MKVKDLIERYDGLYPGSNPVILADGFSEVQELRALVGDILLYLQEQEAGPPVYVPEPRLGPQPISEADAIECGKRLGEIVRVAEKELLKESGGLNTRKLDTLLIELDKAEANDSGQRAALERFHEAARIMAESVAARLLLAEAGAGDFTVYELLYAAGFRCVCGAGMAYPDDIGMHGSWYCSAILLGQATPGTEHTPAHPFSFYEVKSEDQPSAYGATTRPAGTHVETEPHYACHHCGNTGTWPRYRGSLSDCPDRKDLACSQCGIRYLNDNGSSNSKIHTRWFHVVVDDESNPSVLKRPEGSDLKDFGDAMIRFIDLRRRAGMDFL